VSVILHDAREVCLLFRDRRWCFRDRRFVFHKVGL
jgi:hypothetical protein